MTTPAPPKGTKAEGRRLWRSVVGQFELEDHERALLREAVRLVDTLDELHAIVERDGLVITAPNGGERVHPAAVEARQSRIALARILPVLRLPEGEDEGVRRPQRRSGARGIYAVRPLRDTGGAS